MRILGCAALAGLACVSAAPASAQLMTTKSLSAGMAMTMAQTAMETCKTNGYKVSVTVVGNNGEVILQVRGDGTGPHTMENSMRKAYTARTTRNASGEMAKRLKADPQLSLVHAAEYRRGAGRAADQGRRRRHRRDRRVRRAGRRKGRSLRPSRHRQGCRHAQVSIRFLSPRARAGRDRTANLEIVG